MACADCGLRWPERGSSTLRAPVRVPETHTLFVGPQSCARRHGLGGVAQGCGASQSYLNLSEVDLACGCTEGLVVDAIGRIREARAVVPRAWFVWLRCVHHLAGVDAEALRTMLEDAYPSERFVVCSMNPIAMGDDRPAPGLAIHRAYYSLVEPATVRDRGVVLVGLPFVSDCEWGDLRGVLAGRGLGPLRTLAKCTTYEEYQAMGRSCAVLSRHPLWASVGAAVARQLEVPWIEGDAAEGADEIARRCAEALGAL